MPLGHLGLNVSDLVRSKAYYDELMPMLGFEPVPFVEKGEFAYRRTDDKIGTWLFFYPAQEDGGYSRHRTGLQHLAFIVKSRAAVHEIHEWAVRQGSPIVHEPKEWPQYHPGYYAVFWQDPDGFMLEAVCHRDTTP